ncbi:F-box protein CPR1-like [Mercurialis annua]|uniref:F-box protein CPR1-like n=1 Tax=Mercurialis annua TaxID=3986 RepID=UPI00215F2898|nr:F-box protein CPR1-like [Mercurialis annua]
MEKLPEAAVAAAASDVPIDVICGILSYLPVKSVLRFRCVSKSWCSLINDSHFKRSHLLQSRDQVLVRQLQCPDKYYSFHGGPFFDDIVSGESREMESLFPRIPNPPICNATKLLAACDGLLLMKNCDNGQLTLLNPSTGQCRNLQDVKYDFASPGGRCCYGLGYDSSTDDYKILVLADYHFEKERRLKTETKLFSVKTNCWRKVKSPGMSNNNAVNLNGCMIWVSTLYWKSNGMHLNKIVSLSLADETIIEMEHPYYYYDEIPWPDVGVLQGCVCLTVAGSRSLTIWLMKEFGVTSSWTKVITLPNLDFRRATPLPVNHMNKTVFLLDGWVNGVELLILNDLEAEDYKIVKITNFPRRNFPHLLTFSRSLISPN